jgi:hypothetical protein
MQIQILTPDSVLNIIVDVVDMDMPLLIDLDVLDRYRLQMLTADNVLQLTPVPGHGPSIVANGYSSQEWPCISKFPDDYG